LRPQGILFTVAFAALTPAAFAQTYIVPDGDCPAITFHATRNATFPSLGETIGADRIENANVYTREKTAAKPVAGAHSLDFNADVAGDDVVVAAADFAPETVDNETRTDHAKAFAYCAAKAPAADWQRTTRLGLELYPQWNGAVTHLKPGDSMRFIAVDNTTKKLLDVPMELRRAGDTRVITGTPDSSGGVNFPFEGPGRYIVTTTYRRADMQHSNHWLVDTSTVTFEIK
jgi:hypothetical protein